MLNKEIVDDHTDAWNDQDIITRGRDLTTAILAHRGVGYLLHEGGEPVRMRTFYLTDDDLTALARRAEALRKPATRPVPLPLPVDRTQVEGEGAA